MEKETKSTLTREGCKKDLKHSFKAKLINDCAALAVVALCLILPIYGAIYLCKHIIVLGILLLAICSAPFAFLIYRLIKDIKMLRLVSMDGFSIVKDTVYRISKGETPKNYSEGRHSVDVIYFSKYGRYISGGAQFQLSSVGDEFYLAVLHNKEKDIAFAFHSMMYECKELE